MSTKRQPSKQRRQTQNRQQRAALEARRAAAAAAEAPAGKVGGGSTAAPAKGGSVLSRLTGTGSRPAGKASGRSASRRAVASDLPVGHRAALTSVMLAGASILFVLFGYSVRMTAGGDPIETKPQRVAEWSLAALDTARTLDGDVTAEAIVAGTEDWSPGGNERYLQAYFPQSLAIFLPLLAAGLGFRAVSKRATAKVVNRAMYTTIFGALLTGPLLIFFLPGSVAMFIAAAQVRRVEFAERAAAAADADDDALDGDVIDVDEVDDVDDVDVDEDDEAEVDVVDVDVDEDEDEVDVDERTS